MPKPLIIHGHFYQPPRENPWTGEVEREGGADPYHDWNDRIFHECYRANAFARVVDEAGAIEQIVNNYEYVSFNFGPTLLTWLEKQHPKAYRRVIAADRESIRSQAGHGNAMAQAYNHAILPLCNDRDRFTQVKWGIADFRHRFGREPEGMWLPETACNNETLGTLIDEGLKFTILSPYQALRVRSLSGDAWTDVSGGRVDTSRPYRFFHPSGSGGHVDIFFYDGPRSRSIAFEGALGSSQRFLEQLVHASDERLVAVATDGESYGHHTHFGDRSLAHALAVEAPRRDIQVTNFARYLAEHPPEHQVEIQLGEKGLGSSWSCEHGVGRWFRDCGCQTGAQEGWNQRWREPLRMALDYVRDAAAEIFSNATPLFSDPWSARNDYIEMIWNLDGARAGFLKNHVKADSKEDEIRAFSLLEMQRSALLMYTSCGWFFSDISGVETLQILKYACRTIDFIAERGLPEVRDGFLERLSEAQSNRKDAGNGADIFRRSVEPSRVTADRVAAHLAMSSIVHEHGTRGKIAGYRFKSKDLHQRQHGKLSLITGRYQLEHEATGLSSEKSAVAMHFGGIDFYSVVRSFQDEVSHRDAASRLWKVFPTASLASLLRLAAQEFGPEEFGLEHVLPEGRERISQTIFGSLLTRFLVRYANLYEDNQRTLDMLHSAGFTLPKELRAAAEFTLGRRLEHEIRNQQESQDPTAYRRAVEIAEEVAERGYQIDRSASIGSFAKLVTRTVEAALKTRSAEYASAAIDLIDVSARLGLSINLEESQEAMYEQTSAMKESVTEPFLRLTEALRLSSKVLP